MFDPVTRIFHVGAQALAGLHFGLFDGSYFGDKDTPYGQAKAAELKDRFINQVPLAYAQQAIIPPVPPLWSAGVNTLGWMTGKDISMSQFGDVRIHDPNRRGGLAPRTTAANPFAEHVPAQFEDIMNSLGGTNFKLIYQFLNGMLSDTNDRNWQTGNKTYTVGEAFGRRADEYGQTIADNAPLIGTIFNTFRTRTPSMTA